MAISVYCGVMGSGKSYEGVKTAIVPAIARGRRVVTNISGINEAAIHDYLVKKGHDPAKLGKVIHFENDALKHPGFFPSEAQPEFKFDVPDWIPREALRVYAESYTVSQGKTFGKVAFQALLPDLKKLHDYKLDLTSCLLEAAQKDWKTFTVSFFEDRPRGEPWMTLESSGPSVVQPGDLVVVDECWLFWSDAHKLEPEHMLFFRMHRHYVHPETGESCDVLLMIQDFPSLNRFIRGVCELVLYFYKLKSLGLMNRYRVETYEGRPSKKTLVSTSAWQKYQPEYFPLYSSYDGAKGKEGQIDKRQNLFSNKFFLFSMALALCLLVYGWGSLFKKINSWRNPQSNQKNGSLISPAAPVSSNSNGSPVLQSSSLRLVGIVTHGTETYLYVDTGDGHIIRRQMTGGIQDGWSSWAWIDGKQRAEFKLTHSTGVKK